MTEALVSLVHNVNVKSNFYNPGHKVVGAISLTYDFNYVLDDLEKD